MQRALDALPDVFKDAVILVDIEDQSYDTAAAVIGVPVGTIRSRVDRGRRLLQERLLAYATDIDGRDQAATIHRGFRETPVRLV